MLDKDEIKKEVAVRNNVLLGDDDSVMIVATMVEVILKQCVDELNRENENHLKALLNALQSGNKEAKITGGMVITDATSHVRDEVNKAVSCAMSKGRDEIKELLSNYMAGMDNMRYEATTAKNMAYIAMGVSVVAMIGSLWLYFSVST